MTKTEASKSAAKATNAQRLIEAAAANGGSIAFTVGAGTGNTLHTLRAIRRTGAQCVKVGGEWQSKQGMQFLLTLEAATGSAA